MGLADSYTEQTTPLPRVPFICVPTDPEPHPHSLLHGALTCHPLPQSPWARYPASIPYTPGSAETIPTASPKPAWSAWPAWPVPSCENGDKASGPHFPLIWLPSH